MEQVCVNLPATAATLIGYLVYLAGMNIIPSPDKISNPLLKFLSRVAHFIAVDVTTAVKK